MPRRLNGFLVIGYVGLAVCAGRYAYGQANVGRIFGGDDYDTFLGCLKCSASNEKSVLNVQLWHGWKQQIRHLEPFR
jgi:hypothetical protein